MPLFWVRRVADGVSHFRTCGGWRWHLTLALSFFLLLHEPDGFGEGAELWIVTFCRRGRCGKFVTLVGQLLLFVNHLGKEKVFSSQVKFHFLRDLPGVSNTCFAGHMEHVGSPRHLKNIQTATDELVYVDINASLLSGPRGNVPLN